MAKAKRGKSGSSTEMSRWELELSQAAINEESWHSVVVFVTPHEIFDISKIDTMAKVAATGLRKLVSVIDNEQLIKEVKELGTHAKGGKPKIVTKPPQFIEICDQAKSILDQGEQLSPAMLAKIIKFKLLALKQKDIDRRHEEKKAAEAAAKQNTKVDDRSRSRLASGKRTKSQSPNKKKGKKDDRPTSPKKDTKLKRRGEEEDTFKTIDDEPDGPNDPKHYVLITGFYNAKVLPALTELGVLPDANLIVRSEKAPETHEQSSAEDNETAENNVLETVNKVESEVLEESINGFKIETEEIVQSLPSGHPIKQMATVKVLLKDAITPACDHGHSEEETKAELDTKLFDEVSLACFKLLDEKEHYKRYIDNLQLISIPDISKPHEDSDADVPGPDMRYYNHLMDKVPSEKQSVQLMLHCLLEQVNANVTGDNPVPEKGEAESSPATILENYINQKLAQFSLNGVDQYCNISKGDKPKPSNQPAIIYSKDQVQERLHDAEIRDDFNPIIIERRMFQCHPLNRLSTALNIDDQHMTRILAHKQQVISLWQSKTSSNASDPFLRGLQYLLFESLPLKIVDSYGDVEEPDPADSDFLDNFDDPFYDLYCPEGRLKLQYDTAAFRRKLDQWCFVEPHEADIMIQVLADAVATHPFIDSYFHRSTNSLLIILHNPSGSTLQNNLVWDNWVHGNVGFRNYVDYVSDNIDDWQREADQFEEMKRVQIADSKSPEPVPSPIPLKPDNRNQMMTRQQILEMKAAEEEKGKKGKGRKSGRKSERSQNSSTNKLRPDSKKSDGRSNSAKSAKSRAQSARKKTGTNKGKREGTSKDVAGDEQDDCGIQEKIYQFLGYNIGDQLIHVSGTESYMFPQDGSIIKVETSDYVQGNKTVRIALFKDGNTFVMHFLNPKEAMDLPDAQGKPEDEAVSNPSKPDLQVSSSEASNTKLDVEVSSHHVGSISPITLEIPSCPYIPDPISEFSSLVLQYKDGLLISMSASVSAQLHLAHERILESLKLLETMQGDEKQISVPSAISVSHTKAGSPKGRKKHEDEAKKQEELERAKEQEKRRLIIDLKTKIESLKKKVRQLNDLHLTCPNGLHVSFTVTGDDELGTQKVIRQHFPEIKNGNHRCEKERAKVALDERLRCITQEGIVIKYLKNGNIEILCPDGSVYKAQPYTVIQNTEVTSEKAQKESNEDLAGSLSRLPSKKMSRIPLTTSFELPEKSSTKEVFKWDIIDKDGNRFTVDINGDQENYRSLLSSIATCPKTHQTYETREDGVSIVRRADGTEVVEHTDGTRITISFSDYQRKSEETGEADPEHYSEPPIVVKVECLGYGTVISHASTGNMELVFGEGSHITSFKEGGYSIRRSNDGDVYIDHKGNCLYVTRENVEFDGKVELTDSLAPRNSFLLKHTSQDGMKTTDVFGNSFSCSSYGKLSVTKNEISEEDAAESSELVHKPRLFVLHPDGSGEEILHNKDIENYLQRIKNDPNTAVLASDVRNYPGAKGITVVKPFEGTPGERWFKQKDEKEIIPAGLRERDFKTFPSKKERSMVTKPTAVHGFTLATPPAPKQTKQIVTCPPVLELRHFIQQPSITDDVKRSIFDALNEYRHLVHIQNRYEEGLVPEEPRNEEEIAASHDLLSRVHDLIGQKEQEATNNAIKSAYEEAIAPPPSPPPVKAQPRRSQAEWEKDKIEVAELNYAKSYLKHGIVPPYFDTEEGQAFLYRQVTHMPNMTALSANLAKQTIHPLERPSSIESDDIRLTPNELSEKQASYKSEDISSKISVTYTDESFGIVSPSSHSFGYLASPSKSRPVNPTPNIGAAYDNNDYGGSGQSIEFTSTPIYQASRDNYELPRVPEEPSEVTRDSTVNNSENEASVGFIRNAGLPKSILGSRPGALPNQKFIEIEDPVRRTVKTASVAGSVNPDSTSRLRGFILVPDYIDFGVLKEGCSYVHAVELKNVGVDICRYKIKQPPPSTGLKVNYKPGPVAAGMSVQFEIEIFAVAVGVEGQAGVGSIGHHIEIITETDALYLPVVATVLTAYEYENPSPSCPEGGPSPGTFQLKQRPLSRESLNRPRKFENV